MTKIALPELPTGRFAAWADMDAAQTENKPRRRSEPSPRLFFMRS